MKREELQKAINALDETEKAELFKQIMLAEVEKGMKANSRLSPEQFTAQFIAELAQEAKQLSDPARFAI